MKKILFVINSLTIGGSEKSLISLLSLLDYKEYKVDLLMLKKGEELEKFIPNEVNILDVPDYYKYISKTESKYNFIKKSKFNITRLKTSFNLRINKIRKNSINSEQILYKSQHKVIKKLKSEYDVAIAYSQGYPTYFIVDKVRAKKKIAWINCDYVTTMYDKEYDYNYYKNIDKIIVVSNTIKDSIIKFRPEYKKKLQVILDIINPDIIKELAEEECELNKNKDEINILTVARLVIHHKGYDLAAKSARLLKNNGYKFKWYVVGDGPDREKLNLLIKELQIEDCFILLGAKDNPYKYMKNCDIYVQASKKEGFGLTVVEAKILEKPIVCTKFNTAKELINNGIDGQIVEMNEEAIYLGIRKYIDDEKMTKKIIKELKSNHYNSIEEIRKFNEIINA